MMPQWEKLQTELCTVKQKREGSLYKQKNFVGTTGTTGRIFVSPRNMPYKHSHFVYVNDGRPYHTRPYTKVLLYWKKRMTHSENKLLDKLLLCAIQPLTTTTILRGGGTCVVCQDRLVAFGPVIRCGHLFYFILWESFCDTLVDGTAKISITNIVPSAVACCSVHSLFLCFQVRNNSTSTPVVDGWGWHVSISRTDKARDKVFARNQKGKYVDSEEATSVYMTYDPQ
jgi:hypothetical protein